ncbi:post-transcriptional regulator [Paraliobacillus sp. PM-2]|uniref:post-transcriptional regulator n=1 Tax=Paraliobacillus sp. PM-2 TaxID=1462524 RepID=UPI000B863490|nr:post-transcriptional regulator [Paraliobacillus sp. PM-2]
MSRTVEDWRAFLSVVLQSKTEELRMMGYGDTTEDVVWQCLKQKVWKGNPEKRLYQVVEDILHLSTNIYMSYLTVESYKEDDLMASIAALTENKGQE